MDIYTATEEAYKNGYHQALKDSYESIEAAYPNGLKDAIKHGKWIWKDLYNEGYLILCCSNCLETEGARETYSYCPHCGAKMDLED